MFLAQDGQKMWSIHDKAYFLGFSWDFEQHVAMEGFMALETYLLSQIMWQFLKSQITGFALDSLTYQNLINILFFKQNPQQHQALTKRNISTLSFKKFSCCQSKSYVHKQSVLNFSKPNASLNEINAAACW